MKDCKEGKEEEQGVKDGEVRELRRTGRRGESGQVRMNRVGLLGPAGGEVSCCLAGVQVAGEGGEGSVGVSDV